MSAPRLPRASRVARIAKWIGQQSNPLITELQLETEGDGDSRDRIASWTRGKGFSPQTVAEEIEDILSSILAENESKVVARLVWLTDQGAIWTSFPIKLEPEGGSQAFDGSQKNFLVQYQRHMEAMAQNYAKAIDAVLHRGDAISDGYEKTIASLTRLLETRENRASDLEERIARLRDENAELAAQVTQTESVAEQAIEQAENAASEIAARKESEGTDGQMLKLLAKVASDVAESPKKQA